MDTHDALLAGMVEQAKAVVSNAEEPIGYPNWWSQQHLVSMISTISTIFKIDVDEYMVKTIINATNDIGMAKYRIKIRLAMLLNPTQVALFNGVMFPEAAKARTRALGFAFIELCKDVKLGKLGASEIVSDKAISLLVAEFNRQLKKKITRY